MGLTKIFDRAGGLRKWNGTLLFIEYRPDSTQTFYSYDPIKGLSSIEKEIYSVAVAGENYVRIEKALRREIYWYSPAEGLNGERFFCFYQENIIHGFDRFGDCTFAWNANELTNGHTVDDIRFEPPEFLWLSVPSGQTVAKVSIREKREVFRIGEYTYDDVYDPLNFPESLFVTDSHLYICNMGSRKLSRLALQSYALETYRTFDEPLWEYTVIGDVEYVSLNDGVFVIK